MRCLLLLLIATSSYSQSLDSTAVFCTWLGYTPSGDAVLTALRYTKYKNNQTVSETSEVVKWSTTTGQKIFTVGSEAQVEYVAISGNGSVFVVSSFGKNTAMVWSLADGKRVAAIDTKSVYSTWRTGFSKDGNFLATVSNDQVDVWRTSDWSFVRRVNHPGWPAGEIDFSPDGKFITTHPRYRLSRYEESEQKQYSGYGGQGLSMKWEMSTGRFVKSVVTQFVVDSVKGFMAIDRDSIPYKGKDLYDLAKSFLRTSCECPKQGMMITGDESGFVQWDKKSFSQTRWKTPGFLNDGLLDANCTYLLTTRNVYRTKDFGFVMKFGEPDPMMGLWNAHHGALSPVGNGLAFIKEETSQYDVFGKRVLKIVSLPEGKEVFSIPLN